MTTVFSGGSDGERRVDGRIGLLDLEFPIRRSRPIRWLIACGVLLIAAIVIGTAVTIGNFRERALANSERELENTASLLVRHFDQQFQQLELVQKAVVEQIRSTAIASREDFEREMSGNDVRLALRSRIEALPQISNLSLADSDGKLINSVNGWPAPTVTIADRGYFQALKSAPRPTTVLSEPILDRVTGTRSTILAQSLIGRTANSWVPFWQASNSPSSKLSSRPWPWGTVRRLQYYIVTAPCWHVIRTSNRWLDAI